MINARKMLNLNFAVEMEYGHNFVKFVKLMLYYSYNYFEYSSFFSPKTDGNWRRIRVA